MPKFTQADEAILRLTLLPRAPNYFYKPEDVQHIMQLTEKDESAIKDWAANRRWRASINKLPGGMSMEEYLKASPESLSEQVWSCYTYYVTTSHTNISEIFNFGM